MIAPLAAVLAGLAAGFAAAGDRFGIVEHRIVVAGCPIRIRITGTRLVDDLTAAFGHLPEPDPGVAMDTINCWVDDQTTSGTGAALLPERYQFVTGFDGCIDALDPDTGIAWRRIWMPRPPWWELAAPFRSPLFWLLANRGRFLTHGAAVAHHGGAALIAGPGGSGKSSTALTCLLAGFDYLGDDYTVTAPGDEPRVDSLYGSAKVSPDGIDGIGDLLRDAADFTGSDGEKMVVWPIRTFPDRVVTSAEIRVVLVPTITGHPATTLAPIGRADALRALAPSSILQFPAGSAAALSAMTRLVREVPCRALLLGTDRSAIPGVVAAAIDGRVSGTGG